MKHFIFTAILTLVLNLCSRSQVINNVNRTDSSKTMTSTHAQFPGGPQGLMNFINKNKHYASYADRDNGVGIVNVSFVIQKDGTIGDTVDVTKPLNEFYNKEAIRIIKSMPNWIPATINGEATRTKFSLPIKF